MWGGNDVPKAEKKRKKRNRKHRNFYKSKPTIPPYCLPPEITTQILSLLPVPDLIRCRQVCYQWKDIVERIISNDDFMARHCQDTFGDQYESALRRAEPGISKFHLYRSLSLWNILPKADEKISTWLTSCPETDEIMDFEILEDGYIGVHKMNSITYYSSRTMQLTDRPSILGSYATYRENKYMVALLTYDNTMIAIRKHPRPGDDSVFRHNSVKLVFLRDTMLYYVQDIREIYLCDFTQQRLVGKFIQFAHLDVVAMSYIYGRIYILDTRLNIYVLKRRRNKIKHVLYLSSGSLFLHEIYMYNFFEHLDRSVYVAWAYFKNTPFPIGPWTRATVTRAYGNIFIIGNEYGLVRIYHRPFLNGELFVTKERQVKRYDFMWPLFNNRARCPVRQIDVIERVDGHTLLVAMADRIVRIDYSHPSMILGPRPSSLTD